MREITRAVGGDLVLGDPKRTAKKACSDSRLVERDDIFFALPGEQTDGHQFITAAARQGAAGAVVSKLDWLERSRGLDIAVIKVADPIAALRALAETVRAGFKGPVVGITGSNGKTTTKQMIASVLGTAAPGLATRGNFNSQVGMPLVLSELGDAHRWLVLEMGASEPGNIAALCKVARPGVGVLTSIGPAHLATFGSVQKIAESKWELMDALPPDGIAIAPWGLPEIEPMVRSFKRRLVFFGDDPSCPVRSSGLVVGERVSFRLHVASRNAAVRLPLSGRVNVLNALAAAAAGWVLGRSIAEIVSGLETFNPPPMRMQVVPHVSGCTFINDAYNANPLSVLASVRSIAETYPDKRRILVLGPMLELGEESDRWHFHVGCELARFDLAQVFLTGKESDQIFNGAVGAGADRNKFVIIQDRDEMASRLRSFVDGDTVILFKGSRAARLENVMGDLIAPRAKEGH